MHTLTEIQTAVSQLPLAEQEELFRHLCTHIHREPIAPTLAQRKEWIARLGALRHSIGSSANSQTARILSELREERN